MICLVSSINFLQRNSRRVNHGWWFNNVIATRCELLGWQFMNVSTKNLLASLSK